MTNERPICIVTGGSLGIGLAVCNVFSAQGYMVINLDIRDFDNAPDNTHWHHCDVSNVENVKRAIEEVVAQYKRIDALVCNAVCMSLQPLKIPTKRS